MTSKHTKAPKKQGSNNSSFLCQQRHQKEQLRRNREKTSWRHDIKSNSENNNQYNAKHTKSMHEETREAGTTAQTQIQGALTQV